MKDFLGHNLIWDGFVSEIKKDRLASGYLFYGADGIGKRLVAKTLARYLVCTKQESPEMSLFGNVDDNLNEPCGTCAPCTQVGNEEHPDVLFVRPITTSITVDQIQPVREQIYHKNYSSQKRVVIIEEAHKLTAVAGNSLLKILEEPPTDTHFILITSALFQILPTLRSRTRKIQFTPPSADLMIPLLEEKTELSKDELKKWLDLTEGSPGKVLLWQGDWLQETETDWNDLQNSARTKKVPFSRLTQVAQKWVRDSETLPPRLEWLKRSLYLNQKIDLSTRLNAFDRVTKAQRELERNVNKQLLVEMMLVDLF